MLNLLRKEFIAFKSSLWTPLMYFVVFSVVFIPKHSSSVHLVGIYTAFATLSHVTLIDIKNHNHNFLVTLPISRKNIVKAKYITGIIISLVSVLASYGIHLIVTNVFPAFNKPELTVMDILGPAAITLALASIYLPLFYTLSKKGTSIIQGVFTLILIALAQPTAIFMQMINENGLHSNPILYLILIGILLLFIASYFIAAALFTKKEL
ncbi:MULTISPECIES: ABC-2 transporter permease [Paenibacillus]|uniref:ABC-2 transporter permease n=1 Tax=Paenibacillus alvei TaxID=44250 RepID=A0ABT4EAU8_PAEAL|nr:MULTISPECIES: ABC-2 transporter permease [Paenibacillus]MCY9530225.1 ABC-2 transporter permease [Paenibacillus alvei]SDF66598.1 ABC-2 family transporter protein [Paenibacillus sp. cl6col]